MIPVGILAAMGATNATLASLAVAFGYILEIGFTYVLVHSFTRYLFQRRCDIRAHGAVA